MGKTAIVLSGGGAKGAFQVGVLQRLIESGVVPDVIYGTSVGAINAFGFSYAGINALTKFWLEIKGKSDVLSCNWWKLFWADGLYNLTPLRKKLNSIGKDQVRCETVACTVDLKSGQVDYVSNKKVEHESFVDAVEGSGAIPFFMVPVKGKVDGGVREQAPLKIAIEEGADRIIVVLCNPIVENPVNEWNPSFPKPISIGMRAIDLMEHEVFLNDISKCIRKNSDPTKKRIDLKVYAPESILMDTLEFDPKKIRHAIEEGRIAVP